MFVIVIVDDINVVFLVTSIILRITSLFKIFSISVFVVNISLKVDLEKFDTICESDINSTRFLYVWVKFVLISITCLINGLYNSCQST